MNKNKKVYNIIAIVGPTASGKSKLAIKLAKEFNGEIINADSRQIYKYLNIGTAKDPDDDPNDKLYTVDGIVHHLIDFVEPDQNFSVAEFQKQAFKKIIEISERGKVPFLVGGTGLWIDAVCNGYVFKEGEQNLELRKELEKKPVDDLYQQLEELSPSKVRVLNESERKNPRRLIRLIERIAQPKLTTNNKQLTINIVSLYLSPKITFEELEQRIYSRVDKMFELGLEEENKKLLEIGYSYDLPAMSGIGYKEFETYFSRDNSRVVPTRIIPTIDEVKEEIKLHTRQYAKRQITWFKKNEKIKYANFERSRNLASQFLQ